MNIADIALFKGLSNVDLAKVLGRLERRTLRADEMLFRAGDPGDGMYIVLRGRIALYVETDEGARRALTVLREGDMLGEMALLTGEPRSATAVAAAETELFEIGEETFRQLIEEHAMLSAYFIRLLSGRLTQTNARLTETREAETARIRHQAARWPAGVAEAMFAAAALPFADKPLLERAAGLASFDAALAADAELRAMIRQDPARPARVAVMPAVRAVLTELYVERHGHGARARLTHEAARYYAAEGDLAAAAAVLSDGGAWAELLALLEGGPAWGASGAAAQPREEAAAALEAAPGPPPARGRAGAAVRRRPEAALVLPSDLPPDLPPDLPLADLLARCPDERLFERPGLFAAYLDDCLARGREEGYVRFEAALETASARFDPAQTADLYAWGAEWCRRAERPHKALEYMRLAEAVAGTEPESAEQSLRTARDKLRDEQNRRLVEQAGALLGRGRLPLLVSLALALSGLLYFHFADPFPGLTRQGMDFIGIGLAAVVMWIVRAVPDYLVALFMAMLWVAGGVVQPSIALSGFASPSWLYMLFILALGAAITKSGLLYRFSLLALKLFPASYRGQFWGIVASGALLNPLIPSSSAKVGLGVPIARTLSEAMGFADRSRGMAGLSLTAMVFYGFTAPFVLTGSYTNVMALGMAGGTAGVSWFQWLIYALPAFLVFGGAMAVYMAWTFRRREPGRPIRTEVLDDQLKLIGRWTRSERVTAAAALGSIALLILQPLHGLDYAWVMLLGFAALVMFGVLDGQTLKAGIDWPFLLFIGVAFSFAEVAEKVGVVHALSDTLGARMAAFSGSPTLFLVSVVLLSFLVTLVVRDDAAVILLVVSTAGLAAQAGIHPWVLVFVILLSTDPFFFAYQSPTYLTAYYSAEGRSFTHRQGQLTALGYGLAVLLLTVACVPYWRWLGLIGGGG
ncbi:SLC13 family permease [Cohnella rhizosphaerae]|uniref:Sodium-dependent dicarboxylate transporter SdcS n=1 Tax=Cohnella rhizosphaerae TaxID=1457232 RepID=A0A9X4KV19_9BACL|nr:SLC13 family permease [Cohnella rhizosphaerae]MDG0811654.1 SLC13 family permease [Cohnella rhizosphaerae]